MSTSRGQAVVCPMCSANELQSDQVKRVKALHDLKLPGISEKLACPQLPMRPFNPTGLGGWTKVGGVALFLCLLSAVETTITTVVKRGIGFEVVGNLIGVLIFLVPLFFIYRKVKRVRVLNKQEKVEYDRAVQERSDQNGNLERQWRIEAWYCERHDVVFRQGHKKTARPENLMSILEPGERTRGEL